MTNKEAIEEIRSMGLIIDAMTHGTRRKSIHEALTLAIKALKERPIDDLSEYSDKLWKQAYERGKAEARPQGEWILISERLPHAEYGESDTVLVSACWISDKDLKDKAIFVTEAYFDGSCFRRPTGEVYWNIKVIAWQPLPKPYKEAENE